MEPLKATLDATCLQVFGKISAAVSHDLKNVLAIVNESAGLLDDLALRAAKGIEIPPDRLNASTARILKQVKRGDAVLKSLNRFAHSTDAPVAQVNVAEVLVRGKTRGDEGADHYRGSGGGRREYLCRLPGVGGVSAPAAGHRHPAA